MKQYYGKIWNNNDVSIDTIAHDDYPLQFDGLQQLLRFLANSEFGTVYYNPDYVNYLNTPAGVI